MSIKAVIFDIDDTLCMTESICLDMENEAMALMGRKPISHEVHIETWGVVLSESMLIRSPGIDYDEFKPVFEKVLKEYVGGGRIDVVTGQNLLAIDTLIDDGKKVMLLTSRSEIELKHMLEPNHAIASRVDNIYYKDNIKYHKPDSRAFNELLENNNLLANECVYVGDSVGDAMAAIGAGMYFVATLESGIRCELDFKEYDVTAFIREFPEIVDVVYGLK